MWTNVSCQEQSILFLHLFTTLSATQIPWRATGSIIDKFREWHPLVLRAVR